MEQTVAQVKTFIGYERSIHDAIKVAEREVNVWLAQQRLQLDAITVTSQTVVESVAAYEQMVYLHIITVNYARRVQGL